MYKRFLLLVTMLIVAFAGKTDASAAGSVLSADATLEQTEEYLANVLNIKKPDIDDLESVSAMRDTLATNRYGHNGRNGVVVINRRKMDADTSKTDGIGPK